MNSNFNEFSITAPNVTMIPEPTPSTTEDNCKAANNLADLVKEMQINAS